MAPRSTLTWLLKRAQRTPVASGAALLFANTLISATLSVLFWALAARLYDLAAIGLTTAMISAATLVATIANLGISGAIVRFLPVIGKHTRRLCIVATLIPGTLALAISGIMILTPLQQTIVAPGGVQLLAALIPVVAAAGIGVVMVQDSMFIARRQTGMVLLRGIASILIRFALLAPLAGLGALGLSIGFVAGTLVALLIGGGVWANSQGKGQETISLRQIAAYSGSQYISGLLTQAPQMIYPVLVAAQVSHVAAGAFGFAWMAATLVMALPPAAANVLLTQLVRDPNATELQVRRASHMIIGVTALLATGVLGAGLLVAGILAPAAADQMRLLLPMLMISSVLFAAVRLQSMELSLRGRLRQLLGLNALVALSALSLPPLFLAWWGMQGLEAGWMLSQALGIAAGFVIRQFEKRNRSHG
jgi:O-antigen/teichoic acid export membrane protein